MAYRRVIKINYIEAEINNSQSRTGGKGNS